MIQKKSIHLDAPFSCNKRARDGARGPADLGFARTEAHFMWAETSNLIWILIHAIVKSPLGSSYTKKGASSRMLLFCVIKERETGLEPAASTLARSRSTNWATRAFFISACLSGTFYMIQQVSGFVNCFFAIFFLFFCYTFFIHPIAIVYCFFISKIHYFMVK